MSRAVATGARAAGSDPGAPPPAASVAPLPDGMCRALGALRRAGEAVSLVDLAARLLALEGPLPAPLARRLVAALLGAEAESLPDRLEPARLRPAHESALAGLPLERARFVVVDLETTGLSPRCDAIIEIGAVRVEALTITGRFETLVRPPGPGPLSQTIVALTGIRDAMLADAPLAHRALGAFADWLAAAPDAPFVAHNAAFDSRFVERGFAAQGLPSPATVVLGTQKLGRRILPRLGRYNLDHLCAQFGVANRARHRALGDADATARVWIELLHVARRGGARTVGDLLDLQERPIRRRRRRR
jgi:DNA polymerase III epsilon subunit family exonuclease